MKNEDLLKGVLISKGVMIKKTHDLGLLAEQVHEEIKLFFAACSFCRDNPSKRP